MFYDKKKGKIIVKDLNERKVKKQEPIVSKQPVTGDLSGDLKKLNEEFISPMERNKLLKKKRMGNVLKDNDDFSDNEGDFVTKGSSKRNNTSGDNTGNKFNRRGNKESHVLKFSGEEYQNKAGKGDKIIQGKYEPFAYIQLNPKATSKKNRREALDVFEKVMKKKKKTT